MTRFALALVAGLLLAGNTGCCCLCREIVYWKKVHCNPCGDFCPCPYGYDDCGYCGDGHGWHDGGCGAGTCGDHYAHADCGCGDCGGGDCGGDCGECCGHGGHRCSLLKRLWAGHCCQSGCGETYWGDWHGEPADCCCEPCDHWGNWIGNHDGHYVPYRRAMPAGETISDGPQTQESDDLPPPPPPSARKRPTNRRT